MSNDFFGAFKMKLHFSTIGFPTIYKSHYFYLKCCRFSNLLLIARYPVFPVA